MAPPRPRRLFALDQNFPEPILRAMATALPMADLVPVREVRPELAEVDDWELLRALHQDERRWDGLITNDDALLSLAREMTVLSQTRLTLVVVKGEGHNPVRAVGALLCHLPFICHHTVRDRAQLWNVRVSNKNADEVQSYLDDIAARTDTTAADIFTKHKLPNQDLRPDRWQ
jgi:hypothetical protein